MAAGLIQRNITTASGVTLATRVWVDDTVSPTIFTPTAILIDAAGAPIDINANGAIHVILTDIAGNEISPTSVNEDSPHQSADPGIQMLAVRRDTKTQSAGTTGDYAAVNQNADGDVYVDGGKSFMIRVAPTVTAGAYTANDCMGGEQTLTAAARVSGGSGTLMGITMVSQDDAGADWVANDIEVMIFDSNPAGTYTDNIALDSSSLTDADSLLLIGSVLLDQRSSLGNVTMLRARNISLPYVCSGSANLFAVAINRGGKSPDATGGVQFTYHLIRD